MNIWSVIGWDEYLISEWMGWISDQWLAGMGLACVVEMEHAFLKWKNIFPEARSCMMLWHEYSCMLISGAFYWTMSEMSQWEGVIREGGVAIISIQLSSILHQNNRPNTSKRWLLTLFPFLFHTILGRGSPVAWQMKEATPPWTPVWSSGVRKNFGGAERERSKVRRAPVTWHHGTHEKHENSIVIYSLPSCYKCV